MVLIKFSCEEESISFSNNLPCYDFKETILIEKSNQKSKASIQQLRNFRRAVFLFRENWNFSESYNSDFFDQFRKKVFQFFRD